MNASSPVGLRSAWKNPVSWVEGYLSTAVKQSSFEGKVRIGLFHRQLCSNTGGSDNVVDGNVDTSSILITLDMELLAGRVNATVVVLKFAIENTHTRTFILVTKSI